MNKVLKYKLQTTQNKLIRFVLDLESRAHISKEHFELLNWLPVNSRVDHLTLCHVFLNEEWLYLLKVILYSYLILKKINKRITDS